MHTVEFIIAVSLIGFAFVDAFEAILQPRRVTHRFRFARLYYRLTWYAWRSVAQRIAARGLRNGFLGTFGPLSLLGLIASWITMLVVGFSLFYAALATPLSTAPQPHLGDYLYLSGTTFFTLGYGDITPLSAAGRVLSVIEAGLGFGFLAVIISYLPLFNQAFSRRELMISLLDARAGSPPSAGQLLTRVARNGRLRGLDLLLVRWEEWAAELLESHLSYPLLSYYRSQHDNQSWLAALTTMLDATALLIAEVCTESAFQAQLTFAMARHAAVDLALVLKTPPRAPAHDRFPEDSRVRLRETLRASGVELCSDAEAAGKLTELRALYEPFVNGLSERFLQPLPDVYAAGPLIDNWQRSAWQPPARRIAETRPPDDDQHFT